MSTYIGATDAAAILGVTKPTLYAYVSRGLLTRRTAVDGRTSLYPREEVERLASRSRRGKPVDRPSIDVRVASAITELRDDRICYRGHNVAELAETCSFERVTELLLTGELPTDEPRWAVDSDLARRCRSVIDSAHVSDPILSLLLSTVVLAEDRSGSIGETARRLLAIAPSVLGGPQRGSLADRLARAWIRRPGEATVDAISRALVLLADHGLATSTLGVRVAASVRSDPASALTTGLAVVRGPLHGAASHTAAALFDAATQVGPGVAVANAWSRGRLPGFGHTVYRHGDPRYAPLIAGVRQIPAPDRLAVVDAVVAEAGRTIGHLPNVDLALGALMFVADLPRHAPLFAVARIAGWAAHYDEEFSERPVRYRGLAIRR